MSEDRKMVPERITMDVKAKEGGFAAVLSYGELDIAMDGQHGFTPHQILLASVAGCGAIMLGMILNKMRVVYQDIAVRAESTQESEAPYRTRKIHLHYIVQGEKLSPQTIGQAVELAGKNCPIAQSVKGSIEITESFEII